MNSAAAQPSQDTPPAGAPRTELDVRPVIAAGEEPFLLIMNAVEALEPGAVLVLLSPFDPLPLHRVLGGKGFSRATRQVGPDDWATEYWQPGADDPLVLDVRGLSPPEPMERTLAALETLPPGRSLLQVNDRVPAFLLPLLDERGFLYRIDEDDRGTLVAIWHGGGAG